MKRREIENKNYEEKIDWGESITDESLYIDNAELVRQMLGGATPQNTENLFDESEAVPFWRREGIDSAEVHQLYLKELENYKELKAKAEEEAKQKKAETEAKLKAEAEENFKKAVEAEIERRKNKD